MEKGTGGGGRSYSGFTEPEQPFRLLEAEVIGIRDAVLDHVGGQDSLIRDLFAGKKALPVVLLYAHVMCTIQNEAGIFPASVKFPAVITMGPVHAPYAGFLEALGRIISRGV